MAQTFDVASIKLHAPTDFGGTPPICSQGHFIAAVPLVQLIEWAYELDGVQLEELADQLPKALEAQRYDIQATTEGTVSEERCRKMTQNLLAERFGLAAHWETVQGKIYTLNLASKGLKLAKVLDGNKEIALSVTENKIAFPIPAQVAVKGITMDELAKLLGSIITPKTTVMNKTGLDGYYRVALAYSAENGENRVFSDPDLFSAVEQQLGLKLTEGRGFPFCVEPVSLRFLWCPQLQDPADEMVLETSVNGQADRLVTFNLKHLAAASQKFGVAAVAPPQLWKETDRHEKK